MSRRKALSLVCSLLLGFWAGEVWSASAIRVGHFPNLTHAQAVYGRATGRFDTAVGTKIQWVGFNAGPSAIEALFTDAVDMTYVGPNPAINGYLKSRGTKFVIIAGAASGGAGLVVAPGSGITTERDFNNKTIATPQLGNTQDVAARTWFAEKGYRLKEKGGRLAVVPLSNPDQLTMFRKEQIDAAWTVEPWLSRLEIEGKGRLFLNEKDLWPDGRYVTTHLVANREFLRKNPAVVNKFLNEQVGITLEIRANAGVIGKAINQELKKETGRALPDAVVERAMTRIEFTWDPVKNSLFHSAEAAHRVGFIRKKPNLTGIYELGPLNEVLRERGLQPLPE